MDSMKTGDIVYHKLTGEKLMVVAFRGYPMQLNMVLRRKNYETVDCCEQELSVDPIKKKK